MWKTNKVREVAWIYIRNKFLYADKRGGAKTQKLCRPPLSIAPYGYLPVHWKRRVSESQKRLSKTSINVEHISSFVALHTASKADITAKPEALLTQLGTTISKLLYDR